MSVSTAPAGCARENSRGRSDRSDPRLPVVLTPVGALVGAAGDAGREGMDASCDDSRVSVMLRLLEWIQASLRASGQWS
jgi:hypothetical protein